MRSDDVTPRFKQPKPDVEPQRFSSLKRTQMKRGAASKRARPDDRLAALCEAQTPACDGRAEVRHHKRGRGKPGDDDREHTLDCCDGCHRYIHAHPAESYDTGWLERRVT